MVQLTCLSCIRPCQYTTVSITICMQYFDTLNKKYKITVRVENNECLLIWYIHREHTVEDLLMRMKLVYRRPVITQIVQYHRHTALLDILCGSHNAAITAQPCIRRLFIANYNDNGNSTSVALDRILNGGENELRNSMLDCACDDRLRCLLTADGCSIKCQLSLSAVHTRNYADIPTKSMLIEFLQKVHETELTNDDDRTRALSLELRLLHPVALATIEILHRGQSWTYYQFDDVMMLYNPRTQSIDARMSISNASQVRYLDVLHLLHRIIHACHDNCSDGTGDDVNDNIALCSCYTFQSPENEFFEFDVLQCITAEAAVSAVAGDDDHNRPVTLKTKPLCHHDIDMCAICRERIAMDIHACHNGCHDDDVDKTRTMLVKTQTVEFTRLNVCHHLYHFECVKRMLMVCNQSRERALCPLCRDSRKPIETIQVHRNYMLQTMSIDEDEFQFEETPPSPPLLQSHEFEHGDLDDILSDDLELNIMTGLDEDIDDDDDDEDDAEELNYFEYRNQTTPLPLLSADTEMDALDEIYERGLAILNNDNNMSCPATPLPPSTPVVPMTPVVIVFEDRSADQLCRNRGYSREASKDTIRSRSYSQSQSRSVSDHIGSLSFSVSNSGYLHNEENAHPLQRPSLRRCAYKQNTVTEIAKPRL